ncbi:MAG TPA: hypothetical protein VGJ53_04585 [Micromonosporaceae bacterium]|jgi:mRNA-degrading endonuclease RelE of RelBE toxin-antitoxin system
MSDLFAPGPEPVEPTAADLPPRRFNRRREKVVAEIQRNRRGEYRVPTWVLALALVLLVGGWTLLIVLS